MERPFKIKICGLIYPDNARDVGKLSPDLVGFIFYKKSARFVGKTPGHDLFDQLPENIMKVGVFVNENPSRIAELMNTYRLDYCQLHGNESVDDCQALREKGFSIIKAFSVDDDFDFSITKVYKKSCDYFLFDTKGKDFGGNGLVFNWSVLNRYHDDTPFFLSGGLGVENIDSALDFSHSQLAGV
jgi:phosphoribosylanthranilate isomerase